MNIPDNLRYTRTHEWLRVDGDEATIGITDFAQSELGDIVYVEMPEVGRFLQQEEGFGTVESVKTVSDLYAPVTGEVVAVNEALNANSELANSDPYGEGWLVRVKLDKPDQVADMLDASAYRSVVEGQ